MGMSADLPPTAFYELPAPIAEVNAELVEIILGVNTYFDDSAKTAQWLLTKNPQFGNIAPLRLIQIGRGNKVLYFVENALRENMGAPDVP